MLKRLLSLLLVAGALLGLYLNPLKVDVSFSEQAKPISVTTQARDLNLVCPGALFQAGGSTGTSLEVSRVGRATLSGAFASGSELKLVEKRLVQGAPLLSGLVSDSLGDAKSLIVQDSTGKAAQGSALLSATQIQKVALSNLSGLAGANCIRPVNDAWLVGGDTSSGRETLLILANPTEVDATVNLEILGPGGPIMAPGLSSISAPKSKTTVIPVSGLVPNLSTFAIHVVSSGGSLGVWLQQRTVRGLVAGGVDLIGPSADASTRQTIPGVYLRGVVDAGKLVRRGSAFADLVPMLRVTSTSNKQTTVTAQILGANDKTFGTVIQQVVGANSTVDIPITGLRDGDYVAFVDSAEPVRASIRLSRTKATQTDFAWLPAVLALSNELGFSTPAGTVTKLAIANPGSKLATVKVAGKVILVKPSATVTVVLSAGSSARISSDVPVSATQVIDLGGLLAVLPVIDYKNLGGQLKISVR